MFRNSGLLLFLLGMTLAWTGCHRRRPVIVTPGGTPKGRPAPPPAPIIQGEEGIASWYGRPFHGRATASGETYNMHSMTAAHRTLPFGTRVRVLDLENNQSVIVRINDRGPFVPGRIIDLSYAAAQSLHMPGTALVRLEILNLGPSATEGLYAVQVGAFEDRRNAERLKQRIERRFQPVIIQTYNNGSGALNRVLVGQKSTESQAEALANSLMDAKLVTQAFVVRIN